MEAIARALSGPVERCSRGSGPQAVRPSAGRMRSTVRRAGARIRLRGTPRGHAGSPGGIPLGRRGRILILPFDTRISWPRRFRCRPSVRCGRSGRRGRHGRGSRYGAGKVRFRVRRWVGCRRCGTATSSIHPASMAPGHGLDARSPAACVSASARRGGLGFGVVPEVVRRFRRGGGGRIRFFGTA